MQSEESSNSKQFIDAHQRGSGSNSPAGPGNKLVLVAIFDNANTGNTVYIAMDFLIQNERVFYAKEGKLYCVRSGKTIDLSALRREDDEKFCGCNKQQRCHRYTNYFGNVMW